MLWESYYTSLHFQRESGNYMHQLFLIYETVSTQADTYGLIQSGDWAYMEVVNGRASSQWE